MANSLQFRRSLHNGRHSWPTCLSAGLPEWRLQSKARDGSTLRGLRLSWDNGQQPNVAVIGTSHAGTADGRQQTADSRQQTADSRQQTADSRQQTNIGISAKKLTAGFDVLLREAVLFQ
jgi:hypothetical protein